MADPQPTDAHLRVAHSINEAIMMRDFSKRQRKILDLILRLSWGCGKKVAIIPRQKDFEAVGVGEGHIKAELSWLVESKIIVISESQYSFNKNYDDWQVSRVKPFLPKRLTELVRINLNGSKPQLTKTVRTNLPKQEETTYQNSKNPKAKLASPKEITKENPKEKEVKVGREGEAPPSPLHLNIYNEFINNFYWAFGRQPNTKERAQIRDLSHELTEHKCSEGMVKDALKEAAGYNKPNLSYVRAVLLNWLGVKR